MPLTCYGVTISFCTGVKRMNTMRTVSLSLCLLIASGGVTAAVHAADPKTTAPATAPDAVARITISAGSYYFKPDRIVVKVGTRVELTISKEPGMTPHDFIIRAAEAGIVVDQELTTDSTRVTFTPTAAGKFTFYCSKKLLFFASHRERGMEGVLEIVE